MFLAVAFLIILVVCRIDTLLAAIIPVATFLSYEQRVLVVVAQGAPTPEDSAAPMPMFLFVMVSGVCPRFASPIYLQGARLLAFSQFGIHLE